MGRESSYSTCHVLLANPSSARYSGPMQTGDESKQINTTPAANFVILDFQIGVLTITLPP